MRYLFLFIIGSLTLQAQDTTSIPSPIEHRFYFLGDAGEPMVPGDRIGDVLNQRILSNSAPATVVFLGDNIYPAGLPDEESILRESFEKILEAQVSWTKGTDANSIFIPGNHDWAHWGKRGWDYVLNQQAWFDSLNNKKIIFLPRDACPGPVELEVSQQSVLVIIDTQWILHRHKKPGKTECAIADEQQIYADLERILSENKNKTVLVAAHHPLITYGEHGGYFPLRLHIFPLTEISKVLYIPLPIIGSIYPLFRKWIGHYQDTKNRRYTRMSNRIQRIMADHPSVYFLAGHEHALQHIVKDSSQLIVSGSASKTEAVKKKGYARFAETVRGFVEITIHEDGSQHAVFIQADAQNPNGTAIYSFKLEK